MVVLTTYWFLRCFVINMAYGILCFPLHALPQRDMSALLLLHVKLCKNKAPTLQHRWWVVEKTASQNLRSLTHISLRLSMHTLFVMVVLSVTFCDWKLVCCFISLNCLYVTLYIHSHVIFSLYPYICVVCEIIPLFVGTFQVIWSSVHWERDCRLFELLDCIAECNEALLDSVQCCQLVTCGRYTQNKLFRSWCMFWL